MTSAVTGYRPVRMSAQVASRPSCSFPLTLAWPRQWILSSLFSQWHSHMPIRISHPRIHLFLPIQWVCENDGMNDLCVTLGGQPLYCMCDCFYHQNQTGGCDSSGDADFVHSPSALHDRDVLLHMLIGWCNADLTNMIVHVLKSWSFLPLILLLKEIKTCI